MLLSLTGKCDAVHEFDCPEKQKQGTGTNSLLNFLGRWSGFRPIHVLCSVPESHINILVTAALKEAK